MDFPADRNLLFAILVVQMDFVSREQVIAAMREAIQANATPLGQILFQKQLLVADERSLFESLVDKHLAKHDNDPERSLTAIISTDSAREALRQITNPQIEATLVLTPPISGGHDRAVTGTGNVANSRSSQPRFQVLRPHAQGGLGEVFVARDVELSREVALKQIIPFYADDPLIRSRFVAEAEITGRLEHPGVVPVYGLGCDPHGRPYYAMRFIVGDSLEDAIERFHNPATKNLSPAERRLELRGLLGRFIDVCNAIEYAHSRGILHRDLKPSNIMLGKYGETLVVDWGLAKAIAGPESGKIDAGENALQPASGSGPAATQMGSALGTPQYMSPEQAAGRPNQLGPQSDVYSLGATLYCLLTGKAPFTDRTSDNIDEMLHRVERGDICPPRQLKPEIPRALEAICLKAMAVSPSDRYRAPRGLADDLEHWLADEPISARQDNFTSRLARFARRHRAWVQAGAASLGLVTIASIIALLVINNAKNDAIQAKQLALGLASTNLNLAHKESAAQRTSAITGCRTQASIGSKPS